MNYQIIYDRLIDRARERVLEGYCERHHILPRCMGGSDDPANLVDLTAEEHFVAHQLLVKLHPDHFGLLSAAQVMTTNRFPGRITTNKLYGWLRRRLSAMRTGQKRHPDVGKKIGDKLRGRTIPPEVIAKMSAATKGRPKTEEHRLAIAAGKKGKSFSASHVAAMSEARKGKKMSAETRAKMSATHKTRKRPADIGAKISAAKKGKKTGQIVWNKGKKLPSPPPEVIAKRAAGIKAAHAARRAAATAPQMTMAF